VSVGGGSLWIADTTGRAITRVDLATGALTATAVPSAPQSVRYRDGVVWAAAAPSPPRLAPIASGQEIRIPVSRADFDSFDPALGHDADRWQRDYATCAALLNYPDSGGASGLQLRPEIAAAMPGISADGRTYTFRIRPGFRFSPPSGRPVTAETFRYTLERAFSPKYGGGSPAMQLLSDIVGSTAYNQGKARHISGISVRRNALSITLDAPAGAFASRLSEAFFCPVPIGTPAAPGGLTRPIPTAGPYYVASSAPGQTVLLRNPYYHGPRPRRIERIVYTTGIPSAKAVALVDSGAAEFIDGNTTDTDPGPLATPSAAARNRARYVVVPAPAVDGVAFNTKRQLFRDVRIRRAVNLALDRRALAAVYDEQPIDDYIPPAIPGSRPGHVYPLGGDLTEAKRLAGTGRRHAVLYSCAEPENVTPGVDEIIRADLAQIGIDVRIEKSLGCLSGPDTKKLAAADMALITSFDDWGDPAGTIRAAFGLAGQGRQDYWGDPALLLRVEQAERLRGTARIAALSRLDEILVRDVAPLAVFGAFTTPEYFSPRVGCKIFQATYHFVDLGALCVRKVA
jgi:peptide/nickel transport system substrate-binding protein